MNTWKVILATLVIFGAGVITGGLLVSYSDRVQPPRHRPPWPAGSAARPPGNVAGAREPGRLPNQPNPLPQLLRKDFLQNLHREVGLTPEQHERIEKILSEGQERNRELWEPIAPQIRKEMQEVKERVRAALTPEQRGRFEELMKQRPQRKVEELAPPGGRSRDQRRTSPPRDDPPPESAEPPKP